MPGEATIVSLSIPLVGRDAQDRARARGRGSPPRARRARRRGACAPPRPAALHVEAHDRRGHHAEVGQRRVAAADALHAGKMWRKPSARASFSRFEPGSVTATKRLPASSPDRLLHAVEEVRLEDVGLERRARLAGDDEQRLARGRSSSRAAVPARDRWSRGRSSSGSPATVPNVSFQTSGQRLEPPMPSSSACVKPSSRTSSWISSERLQVVRAAARRSRASRSSWPRRCPVQSDASPAKSRRVPPCASQSFSRAVTSVAELAGSDVGLRVDAGRVGLAAASLDRLQQLRERLDELLEAVGQQVVGDLLQRDAAGFSRSASTSRRAGHVLLEACARAAVVAERGQRLGRNGVDGVRPDQLLDVEHVAVARVLGARAGPEHALRLGALRRQGLPPRAGEDLLVALVGELRVGDRHLAQQAPRAAPSPRPSAVFSFSSSSASTAVSMRLTKKLATLAT